MKPQRYRSEVHKSRISPQKESQGNMGGEKSMVQGKNMEAMDERVSRKYRHGYGYGYMTCQICKKRRVRGT